MRTRKSAFDFFFFKILSGSKMLLFQELRCVTTVIPWLSFWRLRLFKGRLCHVQLRNRLSRSRRRLVEFSVSKWQKLTQFHLFTPLFDWKKEFCNRETYKKYKKMSLWAVNIYFCALRNWKCWHNYRRPVMKIPELRWCLTEITCNNPSQFSGMF